MASRGRGSWLLVGCLGLACAVEDAEVPEGMLARVRGTVFGPQDLAVVQGQLGAYAQQRFRGPEGQRALLDALIETEILAQEAVRAGLRDDPRVEFAVLEEIAAIHASAELQRRVPREPIAADEAALRAEYERLREEFVIPERRGARGLVYFSFAEAEAALARFQSGAEPFDERKDLVSTPLQPRDDARFPAFHPILFEAGLTPGDWLPDPVFIGERLLVGKLAAVEPEGATPFEDPAVQERLVTALRAPKVEEARRAWMAELAQRSAF